MLYTHLNQHAPARRARLTAEPTPGQENCTARVTLHSAGSSCDTVGRAIPGQNCTAQGDPIATTSAHTESSWEGAHCCDTVGRAWRRSAWGSCVPQRHVMAMVAGLGRDLWLLPAL